MEFEFCRDKYRDRVRERKEVSLKIYVEGGGKEGFNRGEVFIEGMMEIMKKFFERESGGG
jgi:hypothetical protein